LTAGSNTWNLDPAQAKLLPVNTDFRIASGGVIQEPVNHVTASNIVTGEVTFTASAADAYVTTDTIMVDYGAVGTTNANTLVGGSNTMVLPLPGQATTANFPISSKFRIANRFPDGELKTTECTVTSVNPGTNSISFDASAAVTYDPGDYFVVSAFKYAKLPGNVTWADNGTRAHSLAGGVDKVIWTSNSKWGDLLAITGPSNVFGANYNPGSDLSGKGSTTTYPSDSNLATQCMGWTDYSAAYISAFEDRLKNLMGLGTSNFLFTWSPANWPALNDPSPPAITTIPPGGVLTQRTVPTFLGEDNGYNAGDRRTLYKLNAAAGEASRANGTNVGAYQ
jgi:hypothetical protein